MVDAFEARESRSLWNLRLVVVRAVGGILGGGEVSEREG